MKFFPFILLLSSLLFITKISNYGQITPHEVAQNIDRGINLGNTLEPPTEGGWNNGPVQEYYFDDYKTAGFKCVRIPVRWDKHTETLPPYSVFESWMNRVEQVVDWGLERGFFIILNTHHDDWIKHNYTDSNKERMDSIWSQISIRFKDKSDKLLFEMINEPKGLTVSQVDDFNSRILSIIRKSNPTRIVIYSGNEWSNLDPMINAKIPNDDYLIAYYHSYDPWSFAGEANGKWGTNSDISSLKSRFQRAASWSASKNIPVILSEFGAINRCDYNSRMFYYAKVVENAINYKIPFQVWDDGGDFKVYQREERDWNEIKDILIGYSSKSPNAIKFVQNGDSSIVVSWTNCNSENSSTIVQRKLIDGPFVSIANLDPLSASYTDTSITANNAYIYRIVSKIDDSTSCLSYPAKVHIAPTQRSTYLSSAPLIPGIIEAENYDVGGEGLTYHDYESANIPGSYRPSEGVDIEELTDGGYQIAYIESGEWVEYTINVTQAGNYKITVFTASLNGGGKLSFTSPTSFSEILNVPSTNSWQKTTTIEGSIRLEEGEQTIRMNLLEAKPFNVDKFALTYDPTTGVENETDLPVEYSLSQNYPNPFNPSTLIKFSLAKKDLVNLAIYNTAGEIVRTLVNKELSAGDHQIEFAANNLASGLYFYTIRIGKFTSTKKMVLLK